ncbi:MAG TPA: RHS repeat-associated core domain-containing protein, partial [Candidatus Limnocylindrales bacterium]|nr:RHS repeat-associated core domain-containing protein [Candidatus Limnocylindrales bacterium]
AIFDLHGSLVALCPANSATLSDAFRYDAWGQTIGTSGSTADPWRYRGLLDVSPTATALYAMGARFYSPQLGTFTAEDALAGSAANPLSMNRFLYAQADPETLVDPDGHYAYQGPMLGGCPYGPEDCAAIGWTTFSSPRGQLYLARQRPNRFAPARKAPAVDCDRGCERGAPPPRWDPCLGQNGADLAECRSVTAPPDLQDLYRDPTYTELYGNKRASDATWNFDPHGRHGRVTIEQFIPDSEFVPEPLGLKGIFAPLDFKGDGRNFSSGGSLARNRVVVVVDFDAGIVTVHANPSCGRVFSFDGCDDAHALNSFSDSAASVDVSNGGTLTVRWSITDARVVTPSLLALDGKLTVSGGGQVQIWSDRFPSTEAYYSQGEQAVAIGQEQAGDWWWILGPPVVSNAALDLRAPDMSYQLP